MAEYPKREPFFAHKVIRKMGRVCAAQEIGVGACWLVAVIVHTEDAKRYTGPVTWWNNQLQAVSGFTTWGKLDRARKLAVEAGWLHYESGGKGKVGKYWAMIPKQYRDIQDGACDDDGEIIPHTSEDTNGLSPTPVEREPGDKRGTNGGQTGSKRDLNADPSSLTLKPIPKPKALSSAEPTATAGNPIPAELLDWVAWWNDCAATGLVPRRVDQKRPNEGVRRGWAAWNKTPRLRELVNVDNRESFEAEFRRSGHLKKSWFGLEKLFTKNKTGDWIAGMILDGRYRDDKSTNNGAYDQGGETQRSAF